MSKSLSNIINTIIGLIMLLLLLRLIMRMLGASSAAAFTDFIYNTSAFLAPFQGIFPTTVEGATFELSTLFAIVIYALIGWMLTSLIYSLSANRTRKVVIEKDI